ncbi:MAG: Glycerol-3-phosphate ABC transporter, substrate-binding protein UgpB, partial [uncultured Friedmanniella sp.]
APACRRAVVPSGWWRLLETGSPGGWSPAVLRTGAQRGREGARLAVHPVPRPARHAGLLAHPDRLLPGDHRGAGRAGGQCVPGREPALPGGHRLPRRDAGPAGDPRLRCRGHAADPQGDRGRARAGADRQGPGRLAAAGAGERRRVDRQRQRLGGL